MARLWLALGLVLLSLGAATRQAEAQSCDRLRVTSFQGNVQLQGLYDFCNEYRLLQADVQRLQQQVQALQQASFDMQQVRRMLATSMPVAEIVRGQLSAARRFDLAQPGVLFATGYAAGELRLSLNGKPCGAGQRNVVCQVPVPAGVHTIEADGSDVVLSVVVLIR